MNKTTGKNKVKSLSQNFKNLMTKTQKDSDDKTKAINDFTQILNAIKKEWNLINKMKDIQRENEDFFKKNSKNIKIILRTKKYIHTT